MQRGLVLVTFLFLGVLVLIGSLVWSGGDAERTLAPADATVADGGGAMREGPALAEVSEAPIAEPEAIEPERAAVAPVEEAASDEPLGSTTLSGRLVFEDETPAAGVTLALRGAVANDRRLAEHGRPRGWKDQSVDTDADGRFEFRFEPPGAFQFFLDGHVPGFAPVSWRWSRLEPERVYELGEHELVRGGTLEVRIVDSDGEPIDRKWKVRATRDDDHVFSVGGDASGRDSTSRPGVYDPARGVWRIDDLVPGRNEVAAYTRITNWIERRGVVVVAGEAKAVDLVYDGPDNSTRIVVTVFSQPFWHILPEIEHVTLTGGDLTEPLPATRRIGSQGFDFQDLAPGTYTLRIDDPRYGVVERSGLRPGSSADVTIVGRSSVVIEVVDRDTGARIDDWSLDLRYNTGTGSRGSELIVAEGSKPPADGRIRGLLPMDYSFELKAPGYPAAKRKAAGLEVGEERLVRFELSRRGAVSGRVRDTRGEPLGGAAVELYDGTAVGPKSDWWSMWGAGDLDRARLASGETGPDGSFRLPLDRDGEVLVRAVVGQSLHVLEAIEVVRGEEFEGVELVAPAALAIRGRVLVPEGARAGDVIVRAGAVNHVPQMEPGMWDAGIDTFVETAPDASGAFRLDPLPREAIILYAMDRATSTVLRRERIEGAEFGDGVLELDLRETWPGEAELRLVVRGEPLPGAYVQLRPEPSASSISVGRTLAEGELAVRAPAGDYRVHVQSGRNGGWSWTSGEVLSLTPGGRSTWALDIPVHLGRVLLVDAATGEPLVSTPVEVLTRRVDEYMQSHACRTNAEGWLTLERTAATLWLRRQVGKHVRVVPLAEVVDLPVLDWTAGGPSTDRVLLR